MVKDLNIKSESSIQVNEADSYLDSVHAHTIHYYGERPHIDMLRAVTTRLILFLEE